MKLTAPRHAINQVKMTWIIVALTLLFCTEVQAGVPLDLLQSFSGPVDYVMTGGSFRDEDNGGDSCSVVGTANNTLPSPPSGYTVRKAYLWWSSSGTTADTTATLNGSGVTADETFTESFTNGGTTYDFYAARADVTTLVTSGGSYTISGVDVSNGNPWCGSAAVYSAWAIILVYELSSLETGIVNIFDGFQSFRGSEITLTLSNFSVNTTPSGKVSVVTYDGDTENSDPLGGFAEVFSIDGVPQTDGANPADNQFNSTINGQGQTDRYGLDVDTYDISGQLSPGATSITSVYSSGGDLVLLNAQVARHTSTPDVDLSIDKSHSGNFSRGNENDFLITVSNAGPLEEPGPIQVTDTLAAGVTFVSGSGTDWSCSAVGQDVTCLFDKELAASATTPPLTLTVDLAPSVFPSLSNTANVASINGDDIAAGNDSDTDVVSVEEASVATSTKTVVDLNGGDAEPGDTLRYTITVNESVGVTAGNISVTDDINAFLENFTVISIPAGASNDSTGIGTGANGAGFLDVNSFNVAGSGSTTIIFEADIVASASQGDSITNTATLTADFATGATPSSTPVTVLSSQTPATGPKPLYLFDESTADPNGFNDGPQPYLSRTPPSGPQTDIRIRKADPNKFWTLTPTLKRDLTLNAGNIPVTLWVTKGGNGNPNPAQREATLTLSSIGTTTTTIAGPTAFTFSAPPTPTSSLVTMNLSLGGSITLDAGSQIVLDIENTTPGGGNRTFRVYPIGTSGNSLVLLDASTVIDVEDVAIYSAAYSGGSVVTSTSRDTTIFVRAIITDPFGSFDINPLTQPTVTITDSGGSDVVLNQSMTEVNDDTANGEKVFEYSYAILPAAALGTWTASVTGFEGTEGNVEHTKTIGFSVVDSAANIAVVKTVAILNDPVGSVPPYALPSSEVEYTITVTNSGNAAVNSGTLILTDALPEEFQLYVDTSSGDPIVFANGATASGLMYDYATDVSFSEQVGGGPPYTYDPGIAGYNGGVTGIRIAPTGAMDAATMLGDPSFSITFRGLIE